MPLRASDFVIIGTTAVGAVASLIGALWVGNHQRKKKAIIEASSGFKSVLTGDLPSYQSDKTRFSDCILALYPKHKAKLDELLVLLPGASRERIAAAWAPYEQLYRETKQEAASGAAVIDSSAETMRDTERKQKMQVVKVLDDVRKLL